MNEFAKHLIAKWRSVQEDAFDPLGLVTRSWWVSISDADRLMISLDKDQQAISIDDTDVITIANFAIWFRTVIPSQHNLFIYHDSWGDEMVELNISTTESELIDTLSSL